MSILSVVFKPEFLPDWVVNDPVFLDGTLWQWMFLVGLVLASFALSPLLQRGVMFISNQIAKRTETQWDDKVLTQFPGPLNLLLGLLVLRVSLPLVGLHDRAQDSVEVVIQTILIIGVTWLASRLIGVTAEIVEHILTKGVEDENTIRSMHTWVAIPRRIVRVLLIVLAVALICLQFEVVRSVGVSLIASAGLASVMIGLAAQKTLANVLAGIQLAFAQPIKIGDVVIVEGEYGTIEQINLTHVVVKIWDQRRLILPVGYFLEKPFQNWTHTTKQIMGTIYFYTDYTVSVDEIRSEFEKILKKNDLWDKRASGVLVTEMTKECVQIRLLVSAKDSSTVWDLRCQVREQMLQWLQSKGVKHLPEWRIEMLSEATQE